MNALTLASSLEMVAMALEMTLYLAHVVAWGKVKLEYSDAFLGLFFALALFAASNFMYGLLGFGLFERGGVFDHVAGGLQHTGVWLTSLSILVVLWGEWSEINRDSAAD